jgi:hypothetical protein
MAATGTPRPAAERSFLLRRMQPARCVASVAVGGAIIAAISAALGNAAG